MKYLSALLLLIVWAAAARAQGKSDAWVMVKNSADNSLQIDVTTMKSHRKEEIYVWGLQSFREPIAVEGIGSSIYKVKTYYLINPELSKYSILRVAYYGSGNRVIKEFSYLDELQDQSARYNYPILPGSDVEAICIKTVKYLRK